MSVDLTINRQGAINGVFLIGEDIYVYSSIGKAIIASKDLGAETRGMQGKVFQWGNNYAFDTKVSPPTNVSTTLVDASQYGPDMPLGYYESPVWIQKGDQWWTGAISANTQLWGGVGTGENVTNILEPSTEREKRRGPCPVGYFIPSWEDANFFIQVLAGALGLTLTNGVYGTKAVNDDGQLLGAIYMLFPAAYKTYQGNTEAWNSTTWHCSDRRSQGNAHGLSYGNGSLSCSVGINCSTGMLIRPFKYIEKY